MKHYLYLHAQSARSALLKILRQPFGNLLNLLMLAIALALPVSLVWESLNGQEVRASGPTELVPWSKKVNGKERAMPPYRRIHAERIESAEIVIPSATEPPTMALFPDDEAELDAALERVP